MRGTCLVFLCATLCASDADALMPTAGGSNFEALVARSEVAAHVRVIEQHCRWFGTRITNSSTYFPYLHSSSRIHPDRFPA